MEPLVFEPYLRPQVWGGRRLGELFGKPLPDSGKFGESWELSAHPHHVSRVAEGVFRGWLLTELCDRFPNEILGSHHAPHDEVGDKRPKNGFPLLIKLLDCAACLSVQVHPTDEIAAKLLPGECGKTESWVVLHAGPEARIYAGLLPGTTRAHLEEHMAKGTVAHCLHSFAPRPGDCLLLPAGTVHAVGGGVVMAEVQQSSDATFRLFDWNRLGSDGKPRALHIRESLASIDWDRGTVQPVQPTPLGAPFGVRGEHLVGCDYFVLERFYLEGPIPVPAVGEPTIWLMLEGSARLLDRTGAYARAFRRGETVLVPAAALDLRWEPLAEAAGPVVLRVSFPGKGTAR